VDVLKALLLGREEVDEVEVEFRFQLEDTELTFRLSSPTFAPVTHIAHRPLRADARRNRERVLAAAREVFGEQGREAQMDDVARRAAVGVGTVYRHFPTKEALLEALAVDAFERIVARARECLEIEDPWEALTETLWSGAKILAADRALSEVMADIPGPVPLGLETQLELTQSMSTLLQRAKDSGDVREDLMLDDLSMLMCGVGAATRKTHQCPEAWRRHMAIIIDGLRATSASGTLPS
jgi:AcrR family transcriptional regulator